MSRYSIFLHAVRDVCECTILAGTLHGHRLASDDVLNIRAEPAASSEIIGELGPYTLNVEVLRTLDGWGYIGASERSGWVSMRFLAPNPPPENKVPRPMSCFGT